ncbi:hypothetical protein D918_05316 [Trichuris suis]|nr:hypothetical protein D918_05316 [Trichuris suis]
MLSVLLDLLLEGQFLPPASLQLNCPGFCVLPMLSAIQKNSIDLFGEPLWKAYCTVSVEVNKQGKVETRFLIVSKFRLYVVSPKPTGKVSIDVAHNVTFVKYLRFREDQLEFTIQRQANKFHTMIFYCSFISASTLACSLANSLIHYFPGWPLSSLLSVEPISLLTNRTMVQYPIDYPCGNFRRTYAAVADAENCPYVHEIVWDIEKIYSFHGWKTLNLNDFSHFTARDLTPLILTMRYSLWFTGIWADSIRLSSSVVTAITKAVGEWPVLRSIRLLQCGLKHDFITALTHSLAQNSSLHLDDLDLSFNDFDDYEGLRMGITSFCISEQDLRNVKFYSTFENLNKSQVVQLPTVRALRFRRCGLTFKTLRWIMNLFTASASRKSSLKVLDVSGNTLKSKLDSKVLYGILPYTPELTELNLSFTDLVVPEVLWSEHHSIKNCRMQFSYEEKKTTDM